MSRSKSSYKSLINRLARSLTERAIYDFGKQLDTVFNDYQDIVSSFDTYKRHYNHISEGYVNPDEHKDEIHELAFKNTVLDDLLSELNKRRVENDV